MAEKIRRTIQALSIPHGASPVADCVTASFGVITVKCEAGEPGDRLLMKADELLYQAKSSGRNRVASMAESLAGQPRQTKET